MIVYVTLLCESVSFREDSFTMVSYCLPASPEREFPIGRRKVINNQDIFSDILTPPDWWNKWQGVFGDFCREKFVKWQEIYYLRSRSERGTIGGQVCRKPLYWDNMPYYAMSSWYPSTFMFVRIMKQYFIDNEVYPDRGYF